MTTTSGAGRPRGTAARGWFAIGATSVLGLGLVAASAVSIAGAMPLVDSTTASSVPPITTVSLEDGKGLGGITGEASASAAMPSVSAPAPTPTSPPAVEQAPVPVPQPVAPASADSAASVDSVD